MTTRRQSSRVSDPGQADPPSTSTHPNSILGPTITSEPLEEEPISNNADPSPSSAIEQHPRYRFSLNRILLGVVPLAFVLSKFIDSYFYGSPLTVNLLDLALAVLGFILYWCSLYERDPPLCLRWLLDTDWGYVFDLGQRWAVTMKNNPLETWSVLVVVYSVVLFVGTIVHQSWMCRYDCDIFWTLFADIFTLVFMALNVVLTISGVSKHRAHAYRKSSIIVIGALFQFGSLVIWTLGFEDDRLLGVATLTSLLGDFLVFAIGRTAGLLRSKPVFLSILLCALGGWISGVALFLSTTAPHARGSSIVTVVLVVDCAICILYTTRLLALTLFTNFRLDWIE